MKRYVSEFALFCLIILLIFSLLDIFISNRLKQIPNIAKGECTVWNDIYDGKLNADLVIYGSSRAWVHIDPSMLTKALNMSCYNLGMDGQSFPLQYFRHKELLEYNKRPKIIIHSVDIFTFNRSKELYNYEQFMPYMLFDKNIRKATRPYIAFDFYDFIIPGLRYIGQKRLIQEAFKFHHQPGVQNIRVKGYMGIDSVWNNDFRTAKSKIGSYTIQIDNTIVSAFEKYLEECNYNKTKVILVYTPEYIEGQKFVKNRQELIQLYENIASKFHIPFYNYSADSMSYKREYFYNATHLNKEGSQLFTNELISDLKKTLSISKIHFGD